MYRIFYFSNLFKHNKFTLEIELKKTKTTHDIINDAKKQIENTEEYMDWMSCIITFNMKLMALHIKINNVLTVTKKIFLMITTPTLELICHKKYICTPSNIIYMFE